MADEVAKKSFDIDPKTRKELARFGFDEDQLAAFAARAANKEATTIGGAITGLDPSDTSALPPQGTPEHDALVTRGKQALARGEVGVVILAGGMATRFGGVVKASVPVVGDKSFLAVKVADVRKAAPKAPIYVMTSAATHDKINEQIKKEELAGVHAFSQLVSLRLTPKGEIFVEDGKPSPYATGHGDLTFALRASGVLDAFRASGG